MVLATRRTEKIVWKLILLSIAKGFAFRTATHTEPRAVLFLSGGSAVVRGSLVFTQSANAQVVNLR